MDSLDFSYVMRVSLFFVLFFGVFALALLSERFAELCVKVVLFFPKH